MTVVASDTTSYPSYHGYLLFNFKSRPARIVCKMLASQINVTCHEQAVAFAVLCSAINDLAKSARFEGDRRRHKAIDWFKSGYCDGWCLLLELEPDWVRQCLVRASLAPKSLVKER